MQTPPETPSPNYSPDKKTIVQKAFSPTARRYYYGVAMAICPILVVYGVIQNESVVLFNALFGALFGVALVNVSE